MGAKEKQRRGGLWTKKTACCYSQKMCPKSHGLAILCIFFNIFPRKHMPHIPKLVQALKSKKVTALIEDGCLIVHQTPGVELGEVELAMEVGNARKLIKLPEFSPCD